MPRLPINASQASLIPRLTTPCSLMTHGEQFSGVDAGEASPSDLGKGTESCPASQGPWFQMPKQRLVAAGPGLLWHLPSVWVRPYGSGFQPASPWVVIFVLTPNSQHSLHPTPIKTGGTHPSQGVEWQFCPQTPALWSPPACHPISYAGHMC